MKTSRLKQVGAGRLGMVILAAFLLAGTASSAPAQGSTGDICYRQTCYRFAALWVKIQYCDAVESYPCDEGSSGGGGGGGW